MQNGLATLITSIKVINVKVINVSCDLLFNILYFPRNFEKTLKTIKGCKYNLEH